MPKNKQKLAQNLPSSTRKASLLKSLQNYALILLIGFILADLASLWVQPFFIPKRVTTIKPYTSRPKTFISRRDYQIIEKTNIFNSEGQIPPPLSSTGPLITDEGGPAVQSNLPLELLGTIVHANPLKSVASVNIKTLKQAGSYKSGESLGKFAEIVKIERRKITFKNKKNNRLEFISLPEDDKVNFGVNAPAKKQSKSGISKKGKFQFKISRESLERQTKNLSNLLNQARMLPHTIGGVVRGFRFVSIKPNSIYSELGFKPDDIIKNVNGEAISSPSQALEIYNTLKEANKIQLTVERNGKQENFTYEIQ